jgi:hypothetical protein
LLLLGGLFFHCLLHTLSAVHWTPYHSLDHHTGFHVISIHQKNLPHSITKQDTQKENRYQHIIKTSVTTLTPSKSLLLEHIAFSRSVATPPKPWYERLAPFFGRCPDWPFCGAFLLEIQARAPLSGHLKSLTTKLGGQLLLVKGN